MPKQINQEITINSLPLEMITEVMGWLPLSDSTYNGISEYLQQGLRIARTRAKNERVAELFKMIGACGRMLLDYSRELTYGDLYLMFETPKLRKLLEEKKLIIKYALYFEETLHIVLHDEALIELLLAELASEKLLILFDNSKQTKSNIISKEKAHSIKSDSALMEIACLYPKTLGKVILSNPKLAENISGDHLTDLAHKHPEVLGTLSSVLKVKI